MLNTPVGSGNTLNLTYCEVPDAQRSCQRSGSNLAVKPLVFTSPNTLALDVFLFQNFWRICEVWGSVIWGSSQSNPEILEIIWVSQGSWGPSNSGES